MISHKHKTVFVHIPKAAGMSIEQAFLDDLGLTWEERGPLLLRRNADPAIGPTSLGHLYADEYVRLGHITQEDFDNYYKFTVVRNPYDRLLSEFRYRTFRKTGPFWWFLRRPYRDEFSDFVRHMKPQARFLLDSKGNCMVDKIVHFEKLAEEIPEVFIKVFGEDRPLPRRNKSHRTERFISREDLSSADRARIREMFREDFELLGYDPEG